MSSSSNNTNKMNVAFLHPDLGIGGAERLIVDAAISVKSLGYNVDIYTSRHDPNRAFRETSNGDLNVIIKGNSFPRSIFNRFMVICAIFRNILAALFIVYYQWKHRNNPKKRYSLIIVDQISASIPILKIFCRDTKILFYCHFPDKLLSIRKSWIKSLYRLPIDYFEEYTTSWSDKILVNSKFTQSIFKESFRHIKQVPDVLYPPLNTDIFTTMAISTMRSNPIQSPPERLINVGIPKGGKRNIFLSINRYERKKNLSLALEAFNILLNSLPKNSDAKKESHLVIAGGYDSGLVENVEHLKELQELAVKLKISDKVSFVCSFNEEERSWLLNACCCMLYTPSFEHFGITPLEGMFSGRPVIAVNSGGPKETVLPGRTGYLCNPDPKEFAMAMELVVNDRPRALQMGAEARKWVESSFSLRQFTQELGNIINRILLKKLN